MLNLANKSVVIDAEGYLISEGVRLHDLEFGNTILNNMRRLESGAVVVEWETQNYLVEAFDQPHVASNLSIERSSSGLKFWLELPYEVRIGFDPSAFCLDDWDRIMGIGHTGIPFVLSRAAQAELFRLADELEDDRICFDGKWYETPYWLSESKSMNESKTEARLEVAEPAFWNESYLETTTPGWDLNGPHPALVSSIPQLKLPVSRIAVLGAGKGHDAAYLANLGHRVTAVDFSSNALADAKNRYPASAHLVYSQEDALSFGKKHRGQFDLVFEHTCYCAIPPRNRSDLVQSWNLALNDEGRLLGIFFAVYKNPGPAFGGSEWEVRERLKKAFHPLYWTRVKNSPGNRNGQELLVFAQKKKGASSI